jgi:hypothetical protein
MPDIGPAYVSDGAIIAWLEDKQTEQYTQLNSMMFTSNERSDLTRELTQLKSDIDGGKKSPQELLDEMQSIQTKYKDTDLNADVDALILPMEAKVAPLVSSDPNSAAMTQTQAAIDASTLSPEAQNALSLVNQAASQTSGQSNSVSVTLPNPVILSYKDDWDTKLQGEIDKLGHVDQLDLIKINELMSDSRQMLELGSNIISGNGQAGDTLVANIGRV